MRIRAFVLPLALGVGLLAGCSGTSEPPAPTTTPTPTVAAEPTNLEELAQAVMAEGLVDIAAFAELAGTPDALSLSLMWNELPAPDDQLAALSEVEARIDDLLEFRPEMTQIGLLSLAEGTKFAGITTAYDPGDEVLLAMLEATADAPCTGAALDRLDRGDGPRAHAEFECSVEADDIVGLASAYDDVTAVGVDIDGVDDIRWNVSLAGRPTTDALLRLQARPSEGRQELFVDMATMAADGDADEITIIDSGSSITVSGFADAEQSELCGTMYDHILASGVERARVTMQLHESTSDEDWACWAPPLS